MASPRLSTMLAVLATWLVAFWGCTKPAADDFRKSVFRIRNYAQPPDFASPWKDSASTSTFGTGFYIGDGRIMTNAHVVTDGRFLSVEREDGHSVAATVQVVAHDADLALLTVAEPNFFSGVTPMHFGGMPKLRSPVYTIGFPLGGEKVSITEGGVSRIDYRQYVHSGQARHLLIQVDSAINPGNSGGPVVQGDDVVGVAFQVNLSAQGTGYIIPTPMIQRFLKDSATGTYRGHPEDGLMVQPNAIANPATAAYFGVKPGASGVLVAHVAETSPFFGQVQSGDVIEEIAGHPVAADGRSLFQNERVDFKVYYDLLQIGETVTLKLTRGGRTLSPVITAMAPLHSHYVGARQFPVHAPYLEYGGLVFAPLSRNYLETWGDDWYERSPEGLRFLHRFFEYEPIFGPHASPVVFVARLPHAINAYVDVPVGSVVAKVDGTQVGSLAQMRTALEKSTGPMVVIEFWDVSSVAVLSRLGAATAQAEIAKIYRVSSASPGGLVGGTKETELGAAP